MNWPSWSANCNSIANPDKMDTTRKLLDMMLDEDSELVTLIYGEGVSEDEAQEIVDYIEENM